jgi:streptogramin lyase
MRGIWLGEQDRDKFGAGILAGSASNFHFGLQDRKDVIAYLARHLGAEQPSRAVRTTPEVPFDEAELGKAQLMEYYVGYELKDGGPQTATVGSESDTTAFADQHLLITLQLDAAGNVWAVDRSVPSQLVKLDPRTGRQTFYVLPDPRAGVHDLVIDRRGTIWVTEFTRNPDGTGDDVPSRLLGFNPSTQKWEHILNGDPDNVIRSTHKGPLMAPVVDSKGNVYMNWMMAGAIAKWDVTKQKMTAFRVPTPAATPYGSAMDASDNFWVALWNGGKLARFDAAVEQWTEFTPPSYPTNLRRGPGADSLGNVWVGLWAGGPKPGKIARLDPRSGRWTEWDIPHRGAQPYEASADKDDNIWFPETGGPDLPSLIGRFEPRTATFTFYPRLQFVADSSKLQHTQDGAVWYAPRYGAPPGHSGFGVLYPDKDRITTLAAVPLNGPPGYAFRLPDATVSAR